MARLPNLDKDQLKPEDLKFYDVIADSRGGVRGPYGVLLHSPDLAARVAHTGSYVRYNLDLPEALRETIIIATAREIKSQYEFSAHARLARQAGRATGSGAPRAVPSDGGRPAQTTSRRRLEPPRCRTPEAHPLGVP